MARAKHRDPTRRLKQAEAPDDLLAWSEGKGIDELWLECHRGDWLVWLAAVERVPCVALVEVAVACARQARGALPKDSKRGPLNAALKAATKLESSEDCAQHALACEEASGHLAAESYRRASPERYAWAAAAAGCAARAAEALLAVEARRLAERDAVGRDRAAGIGAGDQIISRGEFPPLIFDPDEELLAMCVYAAASAVVMAARAMAPMDAKVGEREEAEGELLEIGVEVLDPIRAGLKGGAAPATLVRKVAVEPYGTALAKRQEGSALAPIASLDKKLVNVIAAALVFPLGGSGHLYAGATKTGTVLTVGGLLALAGWSVGTFSGLAWLTIIVSDVVLAPFAARRHNGGAAHSAGRQVAQGLVVLCVALILGVFVRPTPE